jgi:glutamate synthase domain-containing protein 3
VYGNCGALAAMGQTGGDTIIRGNAGSHFGQSQQGGYAEAQSVGICAGQNATGGTMYIADIGKEVGKNASADFLLIAGNFVETSRRSSASEYRPHGSPSKKLWNYAWMPISAKRALTQWGQRMSMREELAKLE